MEASKPSILIERKTVYGKDIFYPVCEVSGMFCEIARTKTLTDDMLCIIKNAGFFDIHENLRGNYEVEWDGKL